VTFVGSEIGTPPLSLWSLQFGRANVYLTTFQRTLIHPKLMGFQVKIAKCNKFKFTANQQQNLSTIIAIYRATTFSQIMLIRRMCHVNN